MAGMARVNREVSVKTRRGWDDGEWLAEARDIFFGEDGSVSAMLNGHVAAMFREIDRLEATPSAVAGPGTVSTDGTFYPRNPLGPPREEDDGHGWADNAHGGLTCWYCGAAGVVENGNCSNRTRTSAVTEGDGA